MSSVNGQSCKQFTPFLPFFLQILRVFFSHFARDLVERIPPGKLPTQKLTCIHQLVKSPLFANPGKWFKHDFRRFQFLLSIKNMFNDKRKTL